MVANDKMKITKRQLRRIIKEVEYYNAGDLEPAIKEVMSILASMRPEDRNPEIYQLIDDLENLASRG